MDQIMPHSNWGDEGAARPIRTSGPLPPSEPPSSLTVDEVLRALFRRKWLIIFFTLVGLGTAAAIYKLTPRLYSSQARILVKYLPQKETIGPGTGDGPSRPSILRGDMVVSAEMDLLTGLNLARSVASAVGPERILAALGGGNNLDAAAATVQGGLSTYAAPGASVIHVGYAHRDESVVQPVLSNLVQLYVPESYRIHRGLRDLQRFEVKRLELKSQLDKTRAKLNALMASNSVFALEEAKKAAADEVESTKKSLRDAETQLDTVKKVLSLTDEELSAGPKLLEEQEKHELERRYAEVCSQLEQQKIREKQYTASGYAPGSRFVTKVREDIAKLEKEKKEMEEEHPQLAVLSSALGGNQPVDPVKGKLKAEFLVVEIGVLKRRLERAQTEQERLYRVAEDINELQVQFQLEEADYKYFVSELGRHKFDADLGASRDSNIEIIQHPGPPVMSIGKLYKNMGMAAGGGVALGIALALLLELFIDQRVKRPEDVRKLVPAPLYLSIPKEGRKARKLLRSGGPGGGPRAFLPAHSSNGHDQLQPYFDALRDRVLSRFETLARKPKLVGVCGAIGGSSGATRIAAGLAGALSEAGDLKILLVDMKSGTGKPHPILGSKKSLTLQDALDHHNQEEGLVAPNLYLAGAEGSDPHAVTTSPPRFTRVIPQLNASDYDYVVFDMPEVDQISITPRLAKHMDLMLLVVEAEKSQRNLVKEAGSLLLEFTSNVAVVLNNTKASLPKSLRQAV